MKRHRFASPVLVALAALGLAGCVDAPGPDPPAGTTPIGQPLELRYQGFRDFTYRFRTDMVVNGRPQGIAEGWVMAGTMQPRGDNREWSYTLANIGRDGVERVEGRIEATTDAWGQVDHATVGPVSTAATMWHGLFDAGKLEFPLAGCPRGPVHAGDALAHAGGVPDIGGARFEHFDAAWTAAGTLAQAGRTELVMRLHAHADFTAAGAQGHVSADGYRLVDTRTCMPVEAKWTITLVTEQAATAPMRFSLVHTATATY